MPAPLWRLSRVWLGGRRRPRLSNVSVVIEAGCTAVMGYSGAGKTSLLNLLVGFEQPDAGDIEFHPQNSPRLPVFWVPPDGGLWPNLSTSGQLEVAAPQSLEGLGHARRLLEDFELQWASPRVEELSAGERSRLSLARALAADADVLVVDEPLAHVDVPRTRRCWDVLREWRQTRQTSIVFASHMPEDVLREADRVLCLDQGTVVWHGPTEELYRAPPNESLAWFLGPVNWFDPPAAERWLRRRTSQPLAVRPEALVALPAEDGPDVSDAPRQQRRSHAEDDAPRGVGNGDLTAVLVEAVRPGGLVDEALLRRDDGEQRRVFLRSGDRPLRPGTRARLQAVLLVLLAVFGLGCREGEAVEAIPFSQLRAWPVPAEGVRIPAPRGVHVTARGDALVTDDIGRLLIYDANAKFVRSWWMPEYSVGRPEGIWELRDGRIAVADTHYHRIVCFTADGSVESMFGEQGEGPGQFIYPETVIQDPQGRMYVCEYGGHDRIQRFSERGEFQLEFGRFGTAPGELQRPSGLAWRDGRIYVCDTVNNRVQEFTDDGEFQRVVADSQTADLYYPYDLAIDVHGALYVAEFGSGRVTKLALDGRVLGRYGQAGRGERELWTPWGVATAGDGRLLIADTGNRRMVELTP